MVLDDLTAHDRFVLMLEWMLALEKRHADVLQPGLVHIKYDAQDIRDLTFGASDAAQKLSEVADCLKQAFRGTDFIAREGMDFWILTPFTQIDPVTEKVRQILKTAPQNGLGIAHSNIRIHMLRDHMDGAAAKFKAAHDFLDYLQSLPEPVLPA
jgi:GGDEF domain-containing protein